MPKQIYDVIVIGSGAGGGMAVKTLCSKLASRSAALTPGAGSVPPKTSATIANHGR